MKGFFDTEIEATQEEYAEALKAQWFSDLRDIIDSGRIPPWVEIDSVLQKDEYRLLEIIETDGGYYERTERVVTSVDYDGMFPVESFAEVPALTKRLGFTSHGNTLAVVNRCLNAKWIVRLLDEATGETYLSITKWGRWAKDLFETDQYWQQDDAS